MIYLRRVYLKKKNIVIIIIFTLRLNAGMLGKSRGALKSPSYIDQIYSFQHHAQNTFAYRLAIVF